MYSNCNGCGKQRNSFKCYTVMKKNHLFASVSLAFVCIYIRSQCTAGTKTSELISCIQSLVFGLCTAIFLLFFLVSLFIFVYIYTIVIISLLKFVVTTNASEAENSFRSNTIFSYRRSRWCT